MLAYIRMQRCQKIEEKYDKIAIFFPVVFNLSSWSGHYIEQKGVDKLQQT